MDFGACVSLQGEVDMKREAVNTSGSEKPVTLPGATTESTTPWDKNKQRREAPAPPPVWTRYIDSRLKQFCVR